MLAFSNNWLILRTLCSRESTGNKIITASTLTCPSNCDEVSMSHISTIIELKAVNININLLCINHFYCSNLMLFVRYFILRTE